jgi:phosphoglycolate phosphatase
VNYSIYLFDFDYTLADSEKGIVGSFHHTLKARGFAPVPDEHIRRTIGLPMEDAVRQITGLQDIAQVTAFIEEYRCFADTYMTPNTRFFPETIPTLQTLRARGAHTAVISTKTRSRIAEKFEQDGVMHLLDFIIGREDVAVPKPAPEGILCALQRLGGQKAETLYIGDSHIDARAAQNAGTDFAAVTTGTTTAAEFKSFPHVKIMKSLAELID